MEEELNNYVRVQLKKSSSKENSFGYDVEVKVSNTATKEMMTKLADLSTEIALKTAHLIGKLQ